MAHLERESHRSKHNGDVAEVRRRLHPNCTPANVTRHPGTTYLSFKAAPEGMIAVAKYTARSHVFCSLFPSSAVLSFSFLTIWFPW